MAKSRKWKYNERDQSVIRDFLNKHLEWAKNEEARTRRDWIASKDAWSLGQNAHWAKMAKDILFLLSTISFSQNHDRPEGY